MERGGKPDCPRRRRVAHASQANAGVRELANGHGQKTHACFRDPFMSGQRG